MRSGELDVVVVGAGIGGLSSALRLAGSGASVRVFERATRPGGKMRVVEVEGCSIDAGPTVLTMPEVFGDLFASAGLRLEEHVPLHPLEVLARHAWSDGTHLDLHASVERSEDAIAATFGGRAADGFRRFTEHARRIHDRVQEPFILARGAGLAAVLRQAGWSAAAGLVRVDWHRSLWRALRTFFDEPKLRQLFGRYATYQGSSPFEAPATLAVIAHVEQRGVWRVEGGMIALADALGRAVEGAGGEVCCSMPVSEILVEGGRARGVRLVDGTRVLARAVIANCEPVAIASGVLGEAVRRAVRPPARTMRSLSAMTWCMLGRPRGFDLSFHNVFFSDDYEVEFETLSAGRLPDVPTTYVCAPDRASPPRGIREPERLMCLVNAPARADEHDFTEHTTTCLHTMTKQLQRCGLEIETEPAKMVVTTPNDFDRMFPATGGALYGPATHGPTAAFGRPGARTSIEGLYLVGGGVHPGAGLPMAALSGRSAAMAVIEDHPSMRRSLPVDTCGGTSTGSAKMADTP
jgi:1-hydroxycarotenoid 3,4-desaturase